MLGRDVKKTALFAVLILGFCFLFGYWTGNNPQAWEKIVGTEKKPLVWLFSDSALVSAEILEAYQKETGEIIITVEAKTRPIFLTEIGKADLVLAPREWFPFQRDFSPWSDEQLSFVSNDFQGAWTSDNKFFPLFWRMESGAVQGQTATQSDQTNVFLMGLVAHDPTSKRLNEFLHFLMDQPHLLRRWTEEVKLKSALKSAENWENFSEEQKPSFIRKVPFQNLKSPDPDNN